jgi:hypothetical protein
LEAYIAESDRRCEQVLHASRVWSLNERLAGAVRAAWPQSRVHVWVEAVRRAWPADPVLSLRAVGLIMTVASVTAIAVQALGPNGFDPFSWALPAAIGIAGVILPRVAARGR